MYDKVSANQNFVEREQKIEKFWADNMIFEKSIELRQHSPEFTFYDGPPTANGKPHMERSMWMSSQNWQAAYRPCADPCYQRYDPKIQDNEGL